LSPGLLWRAHLELAECAKRGAALPHVKRHLVRALQAQPRTVQVWLEACRTLDELGELEECRALLELGLECCAPSEQLCLKMARVLERLGDRAALRSLAGSLRREAPERACKVLLEAAHFEVRAGNGEAVRPFLQCLMLRIPHQGPLYAEACRIESILGKWQTALSIAEHGVQTCLKYGPLWFVLIRLAEKAYGARAVKEYAASALRNICYELHWKVHFEVAAAFGRQGCIAECRQSIGRAALCCPKHLRWKVWLLAARSELWEGSVAASRRLLAQARLDAPARVQVAVCIERARTEELVGSLDEARAALLEAHKCEGHDWKVFLEHIFMEARQGCLRAAKEAARSALELHPATGRLWSALIALEHSGEGGAVAAMAAFRRAVREVPKSGEVWCEGARVFLNPLGPYFHLGSARKCLEFAVHLTPQYGDSFLELLRLRFLLELRARICADPLVVGLLGPTQSPAADSAQPGTERSHPVAADLPCDAGRRWAVAALAAQRVCMASVAELRAGRLRLGAGEGGAAAAEAEGAEGNGGRRAGDTGAPSLQLGQLEVLCAYADPNYGFQWFWCRQSALSTPREVILRMREEVSSDLVARGALWAYAWAVARDVFGLEARMGGGHCAAAGTGASAAGGEETAGTRQPPASADAHQAAGLVARDFAIGSLRLARCFACSTASLEQSERRRLIFGSDILCV